MLGRLEGNGGLGSARGQEGRRRQTGEGSIGPTLGHSEAFGVLGKPGGLGSAGGQGGSRRQTGERGDGSTRGRSEAFGVLDRLGITPGILGAIEYSEHVLEGEIKVRCT